MSASGFTPIQLYRTTTASAVPSAGNLAAGELAINLTDERLYFKNAAGVVKLLASNSGALGTVTSVDVSGGTTGLTTSGGPITSSGTITLGGTLGVANGGTGTTTAFTAGSVVFAGASGVYTQDNANLFWDNANDRLGIGVASPAERLDVAGNAKISSGSSFYWGDATSQITAVNGGAMRFLVGNGGEKVRISSAGDVGIGTTTPTYQLELANKASGLRVTGTNTGTDTLASFAGRGVIGVDAPGVANGRFILTDGGNVGIGTSSPGYRLDVTSSGTSAFRVSGPGNVLSDLTDGTITLRQQIGGEGAFGTLGAHPLVLRTNNTERMRIDSSGNVGIGTTTPVSRLHVNTASSAASFATVGNNNGGVQIGVRPDGVSILTSYSGTAILFGNNNVVSFNELMRLDASGNLGLGTASTSGTYGKLTVAGGIRTVEDTSSKLELGRFSSGAPNSYIKLSPNSTSLRFTNAADDTDLMTLTNAGNLGIGTTSPNYKLVVGGASGSTTTPTALSMDGTYASAPAWDRLKFYLFKNDTESYGLGLGVSADMQYWAGPTNDGIHVFYTRQTERMRITSVGDLLVGKTAVNATVVGAEMHANGTIVSSRAGSTNATSTLEVYSTGAAAYRFFVDMGGTVNATSATISAISDIRLKENVRDLDAGLDTILALKPRRFDWKEGKGKDVRDDMGFIAQEVETVLPELVGGWKAGEGEPDDLKSVKAGDLIPVLVKAIQELTARVAQLEGN